MNDVPTSPKGSGATIFFVLGALVVAVAVLAFFALGGHLNGSSNVAELAPAPVAAPAPAVTPPPATPVPDRRDRDRDWRDRDRRDGDRNDRVNQR